MQALGNDYIIFNAIAHPELLKDAASLAKRLSDRHFGIGGDGIIFAAPSTKADLKMRIFNADGSEAEMCGNGIRQLALYSYYKGLVSKLNINIETLAGVKNIQMKKSTSEKIDSIKVNMGAPILEPEKIPVIAEKNNNSFAKKNITVIDRNFDFTFVSMGNPHAIAFVSDLKNFGVEKYGRIVENLTEIFPKRTNVEFIEIINKSEIKMRVWERGSGETLACGTGASASVVACILNGVTENKVLVHLLGGDLKIEWEKNGNVMMEGNAEVSFEGYVEI